MNAITPSSVILLNNPEKRKRTRKRDLLLGDGKSALLLTVTLAGKIQNPNVVINTYLLPIYCGATKIFSNKGKILS
jgi:hypothetical protein